MIFTDIRLQNFRSYSDSSFEIDPGVTIVVGPNTAGKTNLIEALLLLATGKTYKNKESLIRFGEKWSRIDAHTSDNIARTIKIRANGEGSTNTEIEIDNKPYKRLPDHYKQPVVLFEPNHLQLLYREPSGRRDYLDNTIESINKNYHKTRAHYQRVLAQRNAILKQSNQDSSQVFVWNLRLVELAAEIVTRRLSFIKTTNTRLTKLYNTITGQSSKLIATYNTHANTNNYAANLLNLLEKNIHQDQTKGFTGSGPHRDDLDFIFNQNNMSSVASRGEIRTLMLCLKIIELELIEQSSGTRPLLLLDDVFSELDSSRRKALTNFLKNHQTIITTTDADVVIKHFVGKCTIIPLS